MPRQLDPHGGTAARSQRPVSFTTRCLALAQRARLWASRRRLECMPQSECLWTFAPIGSTWHASAAAGRPPIAQSAIAKRNRRDARRCFRW